MSRICSQIGIGPLIVLLAILGGCERSAWDPTLKLGGPQGHIVDSAGRGEQGAAGTSATGAPVAVEEPAPPTEAATSTLQPGTGVFVKPVRRQPVAVTGGDVTLNFEGTDIREVIKVILGDLLKANYILDPAVQGAVTLQTGRPLRRELLLPTLETLLQMNKAALVLRDGTYNVVPVTSAIKGKVVPQLGDSSRPLPEGYSVRVVPLQYVGADEMSVILKPLAPEASIIRVDTLRNLLVIAGTSPQIANLLDTIRVFDVDWMKGLSVGFFNLEFAKARDIVNQLDNLLADKDANPFKGLFRFIPVESANSVLAISPQASYLKEVGTWIERLDQADLGTEGAEQLYVYRVKNGDAENLANLLTELFAIEAAQAQRVRGAVAPGLKPAKIETGKTPAGQAVVKGGAAVTAARLSSEVKIVADLVNNSLLVKARPRDYKKILDSLRQLDITPLQVLIEATIIEVQLSGDLKYGLQWSILMSKGSYQGNAELDGAIDSSTNSGLGKIFPGFNWTLATGIDQIRAVLSLLAGDARANVLSSPSVMVLDNHTARIQVGDQVPIATSQQQGTAVTDRVVNTIEYKDTGVMLAVKPRVTPGGMVLMEIEQEVSNVSQTDSSNLDSPTIQTRNINSTVAVKSNQAVVLGGLIRDTRSDAQQGVPGLYNLPGIGWMFGEKTRQADRTELVVILVPRVVTGDKDIDAITEDFRHRLKGLEHKF